MNLSQYYGKTPYKLFYPHFKSISVYLVDGLLTSPSTLSDFVNLVSETPKNFINTNLAHIVPHLILTGRRDILFAVAEVVEKPAPALVLDHLPTILFHLLMRSESEMERGFAILLKLMSVAVDAAQLIVLAGTCPLLFMLVIELGDEDPSVVIKVRGLLRMLSALSIFPLTGVPPLFFPG